VRRYLLSGLCGLVLAAMGAHVASCNEPLATVYGNPNTLDRKNLPGEGGAEPLVCGGDAGTKKFDGGDCPSFAADVFPYFTAAGKWKCADAPCHGGASAPTIDDKSAAGCFASLQKITVGGKAYVPSDGGAPSDPNATTLLCNLQGGCGSKMPKAPAPNPTTAELCVIEAWLRCGAPR
jgi:hypothetical protein